MPKIFNQNWFKWFLLTLGITGIVIADNLRRDPEYLKKMGGNPFLTLLFVLPGVP